MNEYADTLFVFPSAAHFAYSERAWTRARASAGTHEHLPGERRQEADDAVDRALAHVAHRPVGHEPRGGASVAGAVLGGSAVLGSHLVPLALEEGAQIVHLQGARTFGRDGQNRSQPKKPRSGDGQAMSRELSSWTSMYTRTKTKLPCSAHDTLEKIEAMHSLILEHHLLVPIPNTVAMLKPSLDPTEFDVDA